MEDINNIEKIKMDAAIADYKLGNSWENKFFKKKACKNLDKILVNNFLELIEEIMEWNSASEMEEIWI